MVNGLHELIFGYSQEEAVERVARALWRRSCGFVAYSQDENGLTNVVFVSSDLASEIASVTDSAGNTYSIVECPESEWYEITEEERAVWLADARLAVETIHEYVKLLYSQ